MKTFAIFAALVMTLGVAACSGSADNSIYVEEWEQDAPRTQTRVMRQSNDALRK